MKLASHSFWWNVPFCAESTHSDGSLLYYYYYYTGLTTNTRRPWKKSFLRDSAFSCGGARARVMKQVGQRLCWWAPNIFLYLIDRRIRQCVIPWASFEMHAHLTLWNIHHTDSYCITGLLWRAWLLFRESGHRAETAHIVTSKIIRPTGFTRALAVL